MIRRGAIVERIVAWIEADHMAMMGRIAALRREHGPVDAVKIDAIRLGAGVYDRLRELQVPGAVAANVAMPPQASFPYRWDITLAASDREEPTDDEKRAG